MNFHDAKLQKWATKESMLTFLHHEHSICFQISSVPSLYTVTRAVVEEVFKMHAVVCHVGIAPSADFRPGQPFPSSTTLQLRAVRLATIVGL